MIEIIFSLIAIYVAFKRFGKLWTFHLIMNLVMYLFYCFLWAVILIPKNLDVHHGDSGLGFGLFTLITAPFFIAFNVFSILYSRKISNKKIQNINSIGLIICVFHVIIFCSLANLI